MSRRGRRCQILHDTGWNAYPDAGSIRRALGDRFEFEAAEGDGAETGRPLSWMADPEKMEAGDPRVTGLTHDPLQAQPSR